MHPPVAPSRACPRCGYDLQGAIAAWATRDTCDVNGTCSECGLTFLWCEIFNPRHSVPHWSFEHAFRRRLWALVISCFAACVPWLFWRRLRMEHPVVLGRLKWLIFFVALLFHLGMSVFSAAVAREAAQRVAGSWFGPMRGATAVAPDSDVVFGLTLLMPYVNWVNVPTGAPVEGPRPLVNLGTWSSLLFAGFLAVSFGLLPETLRQAKVRRQHIARVFSWSLCGVVVLLLLLNAVAAAVLLDDVRFFSWETRTFVTGFGPLLQPVLVLVFLASWWWYAIRRYLRLPHAAGVWVAMVTVAGLATAVIATGIALIDYQTRL